MDCCFKPIRTAVSQKRKRYVDDTFNLDLTYLTVIQASHATALLSHERDEAVAHRCTRLIAMGYPASGRNIVYRNRYDDVKRFLDTHHAGRYRVYNLCVERDYQYRSGRDFDGNFESFPMQDHNPGSLSSIHDACLNIHNYLDTNIENIAALHCKAGKGRTGMVVSCYKLYSLASCWSLLLQQADKHPQESPSTSPAPTSAGLSASFFNIETTQNSTENSGISLDIMPQCDAQLASSMLQRVDSQTIAENCAKIMDEYAGERTLDSRGVTIPSQIRFVKYFGALLWDALKVDRSLVNVGARADALCTAPMRIQSIAVSGVHPKQRSSCIKRSKRDANESRMPHFSLLVQEGFSPNCKTLTFTAGQRIDCDTEGADPHTYLFSIDAEVRGEVKIAVIEKAVKKKKGDIVHAWLHAGCEPQHTQKLTLQRSQLDVRSTATARCANAVFTIMFAQPDA